MNVPKPRRLSSGNYFIQLRLGGESISITEPTAKECIDAAMLIKAEHRAGKRTKQKAAAGSSLTLRQAIDNYIESKNNVLSPSTIRGYRTIQRNRFQAVADIKLKDIPDWQRVINTEAKLCSAKTLKNAWGFVSTVLHSSEVELPRSITLPQLPDKTRPWLDYEQIRTFCEVIKDTPCELPALLALSSLRRSEMYALTWDDIDLKHHRILVRGAMVPDENHEFMTKSTTKNASSNRSVPILIPRLLDLLTDADKTSARVLDGSPNTAWKKINRVCRDNDLPEVGLHGLRHSFASLAYHLGISERECMQIGGWADSKTMSKIYTHIADKDIVRAENAMADFYKNANKNANGNYKSE